MDIVTEILKDKDGIPGPDKVVEQFFNMKAKKKNFLNPKIKLSFSPDTTLDEEKALIQGIDASPETEWMLQQQLQKVYSLGGKSEKSELSELALLAKGCAGPLQRFGNWGKKEDVYGAVIGPPRKKRFGFHIWDTERDFKDGKPYLEELDLLKILSVAPDPQRPEVFLMSYMDEHKTRQRKTFARVDRGRDVWVEMLQLLVKKVHEERADKRAAKKR